MKDHEHERGWTCPYSFLVRPRSREWLQCGSSCPARTLKSSKQKRMRSGMTLLRWDYASFVLSRSVVQVLRLGWIPWRHNCNSGSQRNRATRRSFNRPRVRRHEFAQADFAERIGISHNYLSTMERGIWRIPNSVDLPKITGNLEIIPRLRVPVSPGVGLSSRNRLTSQPCANQKHGIRSVLGFLAHRMSDIIVVTGFTERIAAALRTAVQTNHGSAISI